jgi:glycosyltransferase involved in cell wall biosynthesis
VRVLVVTGRTPRHDGKGDQVRAAQLIDALRARPAVTVVTPAARRGERPRAAGAEFHEVRLSTPARALAALRCAVRGMPAQVGWFRPRRLRRAVHDLAGRHDVVVFITVRTWVPSLPATCVVDHIDALSLNASLRGARQRLWPLRVLWRAEARRLLTFERRAAAGACAQILTSAVDAEHVPPEPPPTCIPIGIDLGTPADARGNGNGHVARARDIDLILTGNMRYPPNRRAAQRLADDIAPLVRRRRDARIMVVGRAARTVAAGRDVERVADVPSVAAFLERAKVAMAPIEGGTGVPIKVLEAARAGAAVVLTPEANEGLGFSADAVALASTPSEFADHAVALLDDEECRVRRVEALRRELERFAIAGVMSAYERVLEEAADGDRA